VNTPPEIYTAAGLPRWAPETTDSGARAWIVPWVHRRTRPVTNLATYHRARWNESRRAYVLDNQGSANAMITNLALHYASPRPARGIAATRWEAQP
jgi:hypothetical protein